MHVLGETGGAAAKNSALVSPTRVAETPLSPGSVAGVAQGAGACCGAGGAGEQQDSRQSRCTGYSELPD